MSIKKTFQNAVSYVVLAIFLVYWLFPIGMAFMNSFKTNTEIFTNILAWPSSFSFENYIRTFERMNYMRSLSNTLMIVALGVSLIVICSSIAGWKLARTKTKCSNAIFGLFVFSLLIHFSSIMIPLYRVLLNMNLLNTLYGLSFVYVGFGVRMGIFLYHGFTKGISSEVEESAAIDGCSALQTFVYIVFPLLKPITITICITNTLWIWNDFLLPLIVLSDNRRHTLLLSTSGLFGQYSNDWSAILSALILAAIPAIILYVFFQKNILDGISDGAMKG